MTGCPERHLLDRFDGRDWPGGGCQGSLRDEVYRIAREALRNSFRHGEARQIEVEILYDKRQLRLRDDGKGIASEILLEGCRPGHHGLPGMHERAQLAGGKLAFRSEDASGTEVELTTPAAVAYAKSPDGSLVEVPGTRKLTEP